MTPSNKQDGIDLEGLKKDVGYLVKQIDKIDERLEKDYVTQDQFEPIKKIVYGLVGTILMAVVGAIVALVIKPRI